LTAEAIILLARAGGQARGTSPIEVGDQDVTISLLTTQRNRTMTGIDVWVKRSSGLGQTVLHNIQQLKGQYPNGEISSFGDGQFTLTGQSAVDFVVDTFAER
jgi:hypothetical protein